MKKVANLFVHVFFLLSLLSCNNSDEDTCSDIAVRELAILCVDVLGDISDLSITFETPQHEACIDHYRIFLVKSAEATGFDLQRAETINNSRFTRVEVMDGPIDIRLSSTTTDVDGDLIVRNETYALFVLSISSDGPTNAISESVQFVLEQKRTVEILTEIPIGTGGIVVDPDGNIYSADFGLASSGNGGSIYKITPEGAVSVFATGFDEPSGNTLGPDGNIYQSDFSSGRISRVSSDGNISIYANGMSGPVGLTFDASGNLYVANCLNNTIRKVTPEGQITTFASGSLFNCPNGMTIDPDGNLYVANFRNANLIRITPDGVSSLFATLPGNNLGHVLFSENKLFTIARDANQIYEISLQGDTTKIAGSGTRGHKTGLALDAAFSLPNDLGFSPDGKYLYVNDAVQITGTPVAPSYLKRISIN
ncbi:MAG: SMP-30/gluconolactonase/LRE family protein [Bacteroidota bacterium]